MNDCQNSDKASSSEGTLQTQDVVSKKRSRRTLHRGLGILVFLVLFLISAAQSVYILFYVKYLSEKTAVVSAAPALERIARYLQPSFNAPLDLVQADRVKREVFDLLPGARLFLIDHSGKLLLSLSNDRRYFDRIDPEPVKRMLELPRTAKTILRAQDPYTVSNEASVFAATKVTAFGAPAYLVLSLGQSVLLRVFQYEFDENILIFIVAAVLMQIATAAAFGYLLYRVLTTRIRLLFRALEKYRGGDYSARVEIGGTDDIAELAKVANGMASTIEKSIDELAERDRMRRELIADVTHDLRAPASIIRSNSELLLNADAAKTEAQRLSLGKSLVSSADSLSRLLSQLWELSRLETRERPLHLDRVPLAELVHEIAETFIAPAAAREITLKVSGPDNLPEVIADTELITRALANLIENALTYTLPGGGVEVRTGTGDRGVIVEIQDTGVGISEKDLPQIFERSFRSEQWQSRRKDSSGLGLAIVRNILEAHGSSITVRSRENEGSTFSFELPFAPQPAS